MGKPNKTKTWFQVVKKAFRSPSKEKFDNKDSDMLKINIPMHYYADFCTNLNVTKLTRLE
jgi:hypothetical protein